MKEKRIKRGSAVRVLAVLLSVLMVLSLLSACSSSGQAPGQAGSPVSEESASGAVENTEAVSAKTAEGKTDEPSYTVHDPETQTGEIEIARSPEIVQYPEGYPSEEQLREDVTELESKVEEAGLSYEGFIVTLKHAAHDKTASGQEMHTGVIPYAEGLCTADSLEDLLADYGYAEIVSVEPDYVVTLDADGDFSAYLDEEAAQPLSATDPNDPYYQDGSQWQLDVVNAPSIWEYGLEGESISDDDPIVVAVIDSGINYDHEDIDASHVLEGYSFVTTDTTNVKDQQGHGTFCASEIMATKDNGIGVTGIVPEVYILPLRVFGTSNSAYTSDVVAAINYATEYGADVISMSLGGEGQSASQETACNNAVNNGLLVVAAAGNDGNYTLNYPAATESVIGVGSVGTDSSHTDVSEFSQRGTTNVFCTAPGYKFTGCYYNADNAYYRASGTSMATPVAASLAAVVKSIDRTIDQDQFKQILIETSTDMGTKGRDSDYGYGLIDFKAVTESLVDVTGEGVITLNVVDEDGKTIEGAQVKLYAENSTEEIRPGSDGKYQLEKGRYTYVAKADKFEDTTGSFFVITADRTVKIVMEGLSYPAAVTIKNTKGEELTGAEITIKNKKNAVQKTETYGAYSLKAGDYTYSVSATGYYTRTGSFTVTDDGNNEFEITLYGDIDVASAKLNVVDADGAAVSGVDVTIYNEDGDPVEVYADGYYKLYPGTYRYVAESGRYLTEEEEFVITDAQKGTIITLTIPMLNPVMWVYFEIVPIFAQVEVKGADGKVIEPYAPGEYKLLKGSYSYQITADSYKTVEDSFTLTTKGLTIAVDMEDDLNDDSARVTFSANGGSSVEAVTAIIGKTITRPDDPVRNGYVFEGWFKESSLTTPWNFDTDIVMGRTTLFAKWKPAEYRILYLFQEKELEGLSPSIRKYGTPVTELPVPEIEGWHFEYWCSDVSLQNPITSIPGTKTGDVYVYACCVKDTGEYPVHFDTQGGTEVPDFTATKDNGYLVVPENEPEKDGYSFTGWYKDAACTQEWDLLTDHVTWEMTLYAGYRANTYTITYQDGNEVLSGLEPSSYTYGKAEMTLPRPEKKGQVFAGWYKDAELKTSARNIPAGTIGDLTLYARWNDASVEVPDDCDYEPDAEGNYPEVSDDGFILIYDQSQLEEISKAAVTSEKARTMSDAERPKYRLAKSIALSGDWVPLTNGSTYFTGTFDGAGHGIYGLSIRTAAPRQSLFGSTYHATIENLRLYGDVTGTSFTAAVASEGYQTTLLNIENHVNVTVSDAGKNAGGIMCSLYGGTITDCVNYGAVTCMGTITSPSCIYATGGILGDTGISSSAVTITGCVNYGEITNGTGTPTGGIAGYLQTAGCSVTDSYNLGNVTQLGEETINHIYGTAAGVVGLMKSGSKVESCYNAGNVVSNKAVYGHRENDGYDYLTAAVAFYETTSTNFRNCYFLEGSSESEISIGRIMTESSVPGYVWYYTASADGAFAYEEDMQYASLLEGLGTAYAADPEGRINGGYPALSWQADPSCTLSFMVKDSITSRAIPDVNFYVDDTLLESAETKAAPGLHTYRIERDGYQTVSSLIYAGVTDAEISLKLEPDMVAYQITAAPKDATLVLSNKWTGPAEAKEVTAEEDHTVYQFLLPSSAAHGDYQLEIRKYGFDSINETLKIEKEDSKTYSLTAAEYQNLNFEIRPEEANASLTVTAEDGTVIEPYSGLLYHVTAGTVSYEIRAKGYQTEKGTVTIPGTTTNISVVLEKSTGWNGEADVSWYDASQSEFHLSTEEELAGFAQIATDGTDNFKEKTVYLDEDMHLNNLPWIPIANYSSLKESDFAGVFDGQGHTIDGLSVSRDKSDTGFFSSVKNAELKNFVLKGSVKGRQYTGGVTGMARGSVFTDIDTYVDVTTTQYQAGGIAGTVWTEGSTFVRCRNFGTITSTSEWKSTSSYALGGILGASSTSGTTLRQCVNLGTVQGALQSIGGIAGYLGGTSSGNSGTISTSYNRGTVENTLETGYAGGILGVAYGNYSTIGLNDCLNYGTVIHPSKEKCCGLVGFSNAKLTLANCWYSYQSPSAVSFSATYDGAQVFGSEDDNGYAEVVEQLGSAYKLSTKEKEPILAWEDAHAQYTVAFDISYDTEDNLSEEYDVNYILKGKDADGADAEFTVSNGTAQLEKGTYEYLISRIGYEDAAGTFRVDSDTTSIPVQLNAVRYTLQVKADPAEASVVVKTSEGNVIAPEHSANGVATFAVTNGTYSCSAQAYGYRTADIQAEVAFADAEAELQLEKLPEYSLSFSLVPDEGTLPDDWSVALYANENLLGKYGKGQTVVLPEGSYTYAARAKGYDTARGSFEVTKDDTVAISIQKKQTGSDIADTDWYYDNEGSDSFTIETSEELRGLEQLVNEKHVDFAGKTIRVEADIDMSDVEWKPIGRWNGTHFKGWFDGGGHVITIKNGTMSGSTRVFGLFGYAESAKLTDLVLRGNVKVVNRSDSDNGIIIYGGALAGYAESTTIERISNQMSVDLDITIGGSGGLDAGGIVGWYASGSIASCSNVGPLHASISSLGATGKNAIVYLGGIAGYANSADASNPVSITDCYNTGVITAESSYMAKAAGIAAVVNSYNSFTMKNCYNAGEISADAQSTQVNAALCANDTLTGVVVNNYYRSGTPSAFGHEVEEDEMRSAEFIDSLGTAYKQNQGGYPVLTWENQAEAVEVAQMPEKTEYNDFEDFDDDGLKLRVTYRDGSSEIIGSGWSVKDGKALRVDKDGKAEGSSATVSVTIVFRGCETTVPVTVTQTLHEISNQDLVLDVPVPQAGRKAEPIRLKADSYSADVSWELEGEAFSGTFEEGKFYRAKVELQADYETGRIWNVFHNLSTPTADGILEVRDKTVDKNADGNATQVTAYFTYPAVGTETDGFDQTALHLYLAGDKNGATDHVSLLDQKTFTVSEKAGGKKKTFTLRQLEEQILSAKAVQTEYSSYNEGRSSVVLTGIPLYDLCEQSGFFPANLADDSVVTIGTQIFTWAQIRKTGLAFDSSSQEQESGLQTLLVVAEGSGPLSEKNLFKTAVPMQDILDNQIAFWLSGVSALELTEAAYVKQYKADFLISVKDAEGSFTDANVEMRDCFGRLLKAETDGSFLLNEAETYTYSISASGYGTVNGTIESVSGDQTVRAELIPMWDGQTYKEPSVDEDGYYLIYSAEELMWFNKNATASMNVRLMKDITLNQEGSWENLWKPMFTSETKTGYYLGTFDGNGHTINGLYIHVENAYELDVIMDQPVLYADRTEVVGMFGYMGGVVKDLSVKGRIDIIDRPDSTLASWFQLGGIAGYTKGTISGVHSAVDLHYETGKETTYIGGYPEKGFPECCDVYLGGIAGSLAKGACIENCYSTGTMFAEGTRSISAGGIAGGMRSAETAVSYCYSTSDIAICPGVNYSSAFNSAIGGIVGLAGVANSACGTINGCFALNKVLDGTEPLDEMDNRRICGNRIIGAGYDTTALTYNYANESMEIKNVNLHDTDDFSRNGANGGNLSLEKAKADLKSFTGVGWSEDLWKSTSVTSLPIFYWQESEESIVTFPVTVEAPEGAELTFTGGVDEDGCTTSVSTITFTAGMAEGAAGEILKITCAGGTLRHVGNSYSITDITGNVTLTVTCGIRGDITGDGKVDSRDAAAAARCAAGKMELTEEQVIAGDVDGDNMLTAADAELILQYSAGLLSTWE